MRSLQAKVFLIFALIATLPLAAMSYLAVTETRASFREEVGASSQAQAATAAALVELYVANARLLLDSAAHSPSLRAALAEGAGAAATTELRAFSARSTQGETPLFHGLLLLNATGIVVAADPPALAVVGQDWSRSSAFVLARAAGEPIVLDIPPDPVPVLPLASPIDDQGHFQGVLVGHLGFGSLGHALRATASRPSESVFVADGTGRLLVHDNATLVRTNPVWLDVTPVALALRGEEGHVEYDEPGSDGPALGGYAPVGTYGWAVVTRQPIEAAYEGIGRLTAVLLVLAADLVVAMLLASVLVSQRVVKPVRDLTTAANAMAQGHLETRIATQGEDEIGDLGRAFNAMAERIGANLEDIRRSEERYRSLVESGHDMILTIEDDATVSFASRHARTLLGVEPEALDGRPAGEHVHPNDRLVFEAAATSVLVTAEPVVGLQHRVVRADGSLRSVVANLSPIMTALGLVGRVLVVWHDVTDEQDQEFVREKSFQLARLVSEETEVRPLLEGGLDILLAVAGWRWGAAWLVDDGRAQRMAARGVPPSPALDALAARAAREPTATPDEIPAQMRREGAGTLHVVPLVERRGTVGVVLLLDAPGAEIGQARREALPALASELAVGIQRSVFEARLKEHAAELETKVEERTAMLREKSAEIESFLYSVSHDLKAPLISIAGYAEALEEEGVGRVSDEAEHFLRRIRDNAQLMESLIQDILELSRIGRVRDRMEPVDTRVLVEEVAARHADGFRAQGGEVRLEGDFPTMPAERKRLDQLFTNLLVNALKYRHPDRAPVVRVVASAHDGEARFVVADNGRGFPDGAAAKAFQIFQRFHDPTLPDPGGSGIGLAIVKRIVDTHGGRVWIKSRPGEGAEIHLALPRGADAA